MDFNLPLPMKKNKKLEYIKNLHQNQKNHLKKELETRYIYQEAAAVKNKEKYIQELEALENEKNRLLYIRDFQHRLIPFQSIENIDKRREAIKKLLVI